MDDELDRLYFPEEGLFDTILTRTEGDDHDDEIMMDTQEDEVEMMSDMDYEDHDLIERQLAQRENDDEL